MGEANFYYFTLKFSEAEAPLHFDGVR